jgi:thioredoxin-related protein
MLNQREKLQKLYIFIPFANINQVSKDDEMYNTAIIHDEEPDAYGTLVVKDVSDENLNVGQFKNRMCTALNILLIFQAQECSDCKELKKSVSTLEETVERLSNEIVSKSKIESMISER